VPKPQRACDESDDCLQLAVKSLHAHGGTREDVTSGVQRLTRACDANDHRSCSYLGYMYWRGVQGVEKDLVRALDLFRRGCFDDALDACVGLGALLLNGEPTTRDEERARAVFQNACEKGNGTACEWLGDLYRDGRTVAKDMPRADTLYERACDLTPSACHGLGLRYLGTDFSRARRFLERGCNGGWNFSCRFLALGFALGQGGATVDEAKAREWASKGCSEGDAVSCDLLRLPIAEWK
jgi:TPR repeat protein